MYIDEKFALRGGEGKNATRCDAGKARVRNECEWVRAYCNHQYSDYTRIKYFKRKRPTPEKLALVYEILESLHELFIYISMSSC
jgi:hypothetical protein